MNRRLFLTGASGIGKSTAIEQALGNRMSCAGGFLTVRQRDAAGKPQRFYLCSPDRREQRPFLDFTGGNPADLSVFRTFGVELLEKMRPFAVLDEIGGIELLVPEFSEALEAFLESDTPCIGVMKGFGPASKLIERMGLGEAYEKAHRALYERLQNDPETLLLNFGGTEEENAHGQMARWVKEYAHE